MPERRRIASPRWHIAEQLLPWCSPTAAARPGVAPVLAVQGEWVFALIVVAGNSLSPDECRALGEPVALAPETRTAVERLLWHWPRWMPVLAGVPAVRPELTLYWVDAWSAQADAEDVHAPAVVEGRSLLLSALLALVSSVAGRGLPAEYVYSADLNLDTGRLSPVDALDQKLAGFVHLFPRADRLLTSVAGETPGGALVRHATVAGVLQEIGFDRFLLGRLVEPTVALPSLFRLATSGRSALHSWTAIANAARQLRQQTETDSPIAVLLDFVCAVATRHDTRPFDVPMPAVAALRDAAIWLDIDFNTDDFYAHWVQHHTDIATPGDAAGVAAVGRRLAEIDAALVAGNAVWPSSIKLLGAWARYLGAVEGAERWSDARDLQHRAARLWLKAGLPREATYPLCEMWRLTGALSFCATRFADAIRLHEAVQARPGAIGADNESFVLLAAARAGVLALRDTGRLPEGFAIAVRLHGDGADGLRELLGRIASGAVPPEVPHLRAGARRWLMALDGDWTADGLRGVAELEPHQGDLAAADAVAAGRGHIVPEEVRARLPPGWVAAWLRGSVD